MKTGSGDAVLRDLRLVIIVPILQSIACVKYLFYFLRTSKNLGSVLSNVCDI